MNRVLKSALKVLATISLLVVPTSQYSYARPSNLSSEEVAYYVAPSIVKIGISVSGSGEIRTVGTGIVVRSDGYILTVKHNIDDAAHIYIKDAFGNEYAVGYATVDAHRDLALLKVFPEYNELTPIALGGSNIYLGEEVMAFGYPAPNNIGGGVASISHGIVSGTHRIMEEPEASLEEPSRSNGKDELQRADNAEDLLSLLIGGRNVYVPYMLQIDASVNPGSSGGAIVNMRGELIGVVHSMITRSGQSAGLNFAIPIDECITILSTMTSRQEVK